MKRGLLRNLFRSFVSGTLALVSVTGGTEELKGLDERVSSLSRNSSYRLVDSTPLFFDTHHPQGMTVVDGKIYLTTVDAIDRSQGTGVGYLFEVDMSGKLLRSIELGEGAMYHPGGIDFDGKYIWVSVAEYRPDSSSIIYRVNPKTMAAEEMFRFDDHLGGIVSLADSRLVVGVSWGSRTFYRWKMNKSGRPVDVQHPVVQKNGSHFIDYQDGQWVRGTSLMLFGGLAGYRSDGQDGASVAAGGLALVNADTLRAEFEVPVSLYSERGRVMNQNPFYVESSEKGLTLYFIPDDNRSVLYTYSVRMRR
ncbi:MAG: DUF6454 family protein [Candidatus Hydrogenedentota bacterium]